jgi:hypothetical protein
VAVSNGRGLPPRAITRRPRPAPKPRRFARACGSDLAALLIRAKRGGGCGLGCGVSLSDRRPYSAARGAAHAAPL